jgi:hypothetical protein
VSSDYHLALRRTRYARPIGAATKSNLQERQLLLGTANQDRTNLGAKRLGKEGSEVLLKTLEAGRRLRAGDGHEKLVWVDFGVGQRFCGTVE